MKKSKEKKSGQKVFLTFGVGLVLIVAFAFFMSYITTLSGYYPMEMNDFMANASRARFMEDFFPNINWNHEWGAGMPFFLWYAPFPFYFIMLFSKIFSSIEMGLAVTTVLSFALMSFGIFGIVWEVTKKRFLSLFCAFLSISLPAYWYRILVGTVPRIISTALMMISLWLLIRFLRKYYENNRVFNKKLFIFLVISLALSFQNHIFLAAITGFFATVIIFIIVRGFKEKIIMFFKILTIPLLLSFYFLFPFFVTLHQTILLGKQSIGIYEAEPAIPDLYLYHNPDKLVMHGGGLSPLVLPFIGLFLLIVLFGRLTKGDSFGKRSIIAFFVLMAVFILFGTAIYLGYPGNWYSVNFVPDEGFYFLALITPVLWGLLFYYIFGRKKFLYFTVITIFFVALGVFIWWQYPQRNEYALYDKESYAVSEENIEISPFQELLKNDLEEKQFRLAHPATNYAYFFNYVYRVPETRDFFAQGNLHPDWRAWLENALWEWEDNYDEVNFLLDWYSIKWFVVSKPIDLIPNKKKYEARPDFYESKVKVTGEEDAYLLKGGIFGGFQGFSVKEASPILAASNSPNLLVVGTKKYNKSYDPVIRDLALLNVNSSRLIPVRGKEYIDDYNLDELSDFDSVILYEYKIRNVEKSVSLLNDYVKNGGGLIIEASEFVNTKEESQLIKGLTGVSLRESKVNKDWEFQDNEHELTSEIEFSRFSEALYLGSPWKVNVAINDVPQGEVILLTDGEPVVFTKELGKGRMLFSGLNLPYHIRNNNQLNLEETEFLVNYFEWVLGTPLEKIEFPEQQVKFINPERREVELLEDTSGVLFKENYFANWEAYFEENGKKEKLKIYPAGPDFMYIPLSNKYLRGKVVLQYKKSWLENFSLGVTLVVLLGLIVYILEGRFFKPILLKAKNITLGKFTKKTLSWWDRDEEE